MDVLKPRNTPAFAVQAMLAFGVSLTAALLGIAYLPVDPWPRAFLAITLLFVVTSSLTLAKVVRDQQEGAALVSRVDQARVDRILAEHDPFRAA